jgi:hypothetical protein
LQEGSGFYAERQKFIVKATSFILKCRNASAPMSAQFLGSI